MGRCMHSFAYNLRLCKLSDNQIINELLWVCFSVMFRDLERPEGIGYGNVVVSMNDLVNGVLPSKSKNIFS